MFELQVMVTKMCIINLTQNLLRDYQENLQNGEGEKDIMISGLEKNRRHIFLTLWTRVVTRHQRLQNSLAKFLWPNFFNSYKHSLLLYPLAPMSYQEEFLVTISSRQVIRITKNINWGIISWLDAKFFKLIQKNCISDRKENY